jgi:hypothetical protein
VDYKSKYLKYKEKYLSLKNQHGGAKIGDWIYKIATKNLLGRIIGYDKDGIFREFQTDKSVKEISVNDNMPIWIYLNQTTKKIGFLKSQNEGTDKVWAVTSSPEIYGQPNAKYFGYDPDFVTEADKAAAFYDRIASLVSKELESSSGAAVAMPSSISQPSSSGTAS